MVLSRLTKITGPGVATDTNWVGNNADFTGITTTATSFNIGVTTIHSNLIEAHNIKSTGIITATGGSFSGNVTAVDGTFSGNVSIAGTLTYEDVTNIDSVGIITAPAVDVDDFLDVGSNIKLGNAGVITATSFVGDGSGLIGVASTDNIVTGTAATFNTYPVDINAGMTVAGVSSFTGAISGSTANFSGNVTVGGVLTYEDVKNVDSLGIITARSGVDVDDFLDVGSNIKLGNSGVITATTFKGDGDFVELDVDGHTNLDNVSIAGVATATLFSGASQIGIQSAGTQIGAGITQLNFVGTGNTFAVNGTTVDISIAGGGGGTGAGGTWSTYTAGIATSKSVGVNTSNLDDTDLTGIGNSFKGLYISNGMIVHDNVLNGNHYIGTSMNGLMAGPVTIDGNLEIDGNYVVV